MHIMLGIEFYVAFYLVLCWRRVGGRVVGQSFVGEPGESFELCVNCRLDNVVIKLEPSSGR